MAFSGSCILSFLLPLQNAATQTMKPPTKAALWENPAAFLSMKVPHDTSELNDQDPFPLCSMLWPFILSETWVHTSLFHSLLLPNLNCNEEETPRGPVEATWVTRGQVFRTSCSRYLHTV